MLFLVELDHIKSGQPLSREVGRAFIEEIIQPTLARAPSMPGYGFSGKPTTTGWDAVRIARAWDVLIKRLGYTRYVAQGGDWGALVVDQMGAQAPPGLLGIHTNMPGAVPPEVDAAAFTEAPPPSGLSVDEEKAHDELVFVYKPVISKIKTSNKWNYVYENAKSN